MTALLLENMTWPDVRAALDAGYTRVIIPVASTEQHGHHLPLCTDAVLGEAAAIRLAARLGKTLVAPVIRPGMSPHHMAMPGTLTLRPETFRMLIEDYIDCYTRHGFREIVLLSSHGGNVAPCAEIAAKHPGVKAVYDVPKPEELRALERVHSLASGVNGGHADERETSEMLALRPELVHMDRVRPGFTQPLTPELLTRFFHEGVQALTAVGCIGDAREACEERGEWYLSHTTGELIRQLDALNDSETFGGMTI